MQDICSPTKYYNVSDFYRESRKIISQIIERGKIPLVMGGTGLYMKWIIEGHGSVPQVPDSFRDQIYKDIVSKSYENS